MMIAMSVAKQNRQKRGSAKGVSVRKEPSVQLEGPELRRTLEKFRDTKNERSAKELKKVISDSICKVAENETAEARPEARSYRPATA